MSSKRAREGYFVIDHRDSPGMPSVPGGSILESATQTCAHCNRIIVLNPKRTRARGYCAKCDHYVCDFRACNTDCNPIMKQVEDGYEMSVRGILLPSR